MILHAVPLRELKGKSKILEHFAYEFPENISRKNNKIHDSTISDILSPEGVKEQFEFCRAFGNISSAVLNVSIKLQGKKYETRISPTLENSSY